MKKRLLLMLSSMLLFFGSSAMAMTDLSVTDDIPAAIEACEDQGWEGSVTISGKSTDCSKLMSMADIGVIVAASVCKAQNWAGTVTFNDKSTDCSELKEELDS